MVTFSDKPGRRNRNDHREQTTDSRGLVEQGLLHTKARPSVGGVAGGWLQLGSAASQVFGEVTVKLPMVLQ